MNCVIRIAAFGLVFIQLRALLPLLTQVLVVSATLGIYCLFANALVMQLRFRTPTHIMYADRHIYTHSHTHRHENLVLAQPT